MLYKLLLIAFLPMNLLSFSLNDPQAWIGVTDQVMGGVSDLAITHSDGIFFMKGNVSTENNGGFCSIRHSLSRKYIGNNNILKLKIKGDGKDYQLRIKANRNDYFSYVVTFKTSGEWEEIEIPLKEMSPSFRGRKLNMQNFNNNYFEQIAFLVGNKKNEKFKLIIDRITLE